MVTYLLLTVSRGFSVWRAVAAKKSWLKMSEHTNEETMSSLGMCQVLLTVTWQAPVRFV